MARKKTPKKLKKITPKESKSFDFMRILKNHHNWLFIIFLFSSFIWLFRRYIFYEYAFIFGDAGADTMAQFYPNMIHSARYLYNEGIPLWTFSQGIGQGIYPGFLQDPFGLFVAAMGQNHVAYMIGITQFLKLICIAILSWFYFRKIGLSPIAQYVGVICLSFSGYAIVGSTWYGHTNSILYFLVGIVGMEMLIQKNIWWVLSLAYFLLFGPKMVFFTEFIIIYIFLRLIHQDTLNATVLKRVMKRLIKPAVVSVLLISPFAISIVFKFLNSPRVGGDVSLADSLSDTPIFSFEAAEHYHTVFLRLLSNDIIGTGSQYQGWYNYLEAPLFYCGIISLVMAPQFFYLLKRKQKIGVSLVVALFLLMIVFPFFRYSFYFFAGDYYKNGLSFFVPFLLIYFSVFAIDNIVKNKTLHFRLFIGTVASILILFALSGQKISGPLNPKLVLFCFTSLIIISIGAFLYTKTKYQTMGMGILLLVVGLESLYFSNISFSDRIALPFPNLERRILYNDYSNEALDFIKNRDRAFYRIEKTFGSFQYGYNDAMAQDYFGTKSYQSFNHNNYVKFLTEYGVITRGDESVTRWIVGLSGYPNAHSIFSIKYLISNTETDEAVDKQIYNEIADINNLKIYENQYHLPLGIAFDQLIPSSEFYNLDRFRKHSSLYKAVVLDDVTSAIYPEIKKFKKLERLNIVDIQGNYTELRPRCMELISFRENKIQGRINLSFPSILMLSFPYDIGWHAKVNGSPAKLVEVNMGLTGLYLNPGNSNIELYYRPPFYHIGWIIFGIGLLLISFLLYRDSKQNYESIYSPG